MARSPLNYDAWFDFVKLEEEAGDPERVREVRMRVLLQECGCARYIALEGWEGAVGGAVARLTCEVGPMSVGCVQCPHYASPSYRTRQVYERAVANLPPAEEKRYWQRYIYCEWPLLPPAGPAASLPAKTFLQPPCMCTRQTPCLPPCWQPPPLHMVCLHASSHPSAALPSHHAHTPHP